MDVKQRWAEVIGIKGELYGDKYLNENRVRDYCGDSAQKQEIDLLPGGLSIYPVNDSDKPACQNAKKSYNSTEFELNIAKMEIKQLGEQIDHTEDQSFFDNLKSFWGN